MARLFANSAFAALPVLPGLTLSEADWGEVTSVAPFKGKHQAVSAALKEAVGLPFPAPGAALEADPVRLLWVGPGRALMIGAPPPEALAGLAALAGQSGAQAVLEVAGETVADVLARLVPVDLSLAALPVGKTARTLIGHMTASVTRLGEARFELAVMRSMAGTLAHEMTEAANRFAARP